MRRIFYALFSLLLLLLSPDSRAQMVPVMVDPGPYVPGADIALIFKTGTDPVPLNNTFELYLSDALGNFTASAPIGTYKGFYTTFVNGQLPAGILPGTAYRLRVKSTATGLYSDASAPFTVIAGGAPVAARLNSEHSTIGSDPSAFGSCNTDESIPATRYSLINASSAASVRVTFTNELHPGTPEILNFTGMGQSLSFTAALAHYTLFVRAVLPDGTVGTRAYFLVNNLAVTAFTTTGGNTVCFPAGAFEYRVNVDAADGIGVNFPGNTYHIDWGDNTASDYSYFDILKNNGRVGHRFSQSSCGLSYRTGNQTIYNAFGVNVGVVSPFCGATGSPLSTPAKVVSRPVNKFTGPKVACLGDAVTFTNQSYTGQIANSNSPYCEGNTVRYTWYIDGQLIAEDQPMEYAPQQVFTTTGTHTIRLTSHSEGSCQADDVSMEICVQRAPEPSFTLPATALCLPGAALTPVNTSVIDRSCTAASVTQLWSVTPATGLSFTATDPAPVFSFSQTGVYRLVLNISSGTCTRSTPPQEVVVNSSPEIELSGAARLCALASLTFGPDAGITRTVVSGTARTLPGTYTWTVTGGNFEFVSPDGAHTQYPAIRFTEYANYTVTLTHTNNCGTTTRSQQLSFSPAPEVSLTAPEAVCYAATVSLKGTVTGSYTSFSWAGAGTFSAPQNLTTAYTPTAAERAAGKATVTLQVNTGIPGDCAVLRKQALVLILPENTGTSTGISVCSGSTLSYQPVSAVAGSTFSWTAANADGFAAGYSRSGTGKITDRLTSTRTSGNAVVVYTVTPAYGQCGGVPFTYTVTVTPVPVLTAHAAAPVVCSGSPAAVSLSAGTAAGTRYTWTSVSSGLSGNTQQTVPAAVTAINDVLLNSGSTRGSVTYTITPVSVAGCPGSPVTVTLQADPAVPPADAGPDQSLCAAVTTTLQGNTPAAGYTGRWTVVPATAAVVFQDAAAAGTRVSGLVPGQSYIFRWTVSGPAPCGPAIAEVTVTSYLPLTNLISSTSTTVCSGQTVTLSGSTPAGGSGSYSYTWEAGTDGTAWSSIAGQQGKDLSITLTETTDFRRTVSSGSCVLQSNVVRITAQPPLSSNSISADQEICTGLSPAALTGSAPQGGDGHYSFQWQESTDNGTGWTNISGAVLRDYAPPALSRTTLYRRNVSTASCTGTLASSSTAVKITVKPDALAMYSYTKDQSCAPFVIDAGVISAVAYPDRNASYSWYAGEVLLGTGLRFPGYTISDSRPVTIRLVTTASQGCRADSYSHVFSTSQRVDAAFTSSSTSGCGPLTVNFVNTSGALTGAAFHWDFGNGSTSVQAMPGPVTFLPDPAGKDITYTVTLTAVSSCGSSSATAEIQVKARPVPVFSPSSTNGCSPMTVTFSNTSPGSSDTYYYDFGDGTLLQKNDRSAVTHTYTTAAVKDFVVKMVAENACGREESSYTIRVSPNTVWPELVVNAGQQEGCAPFKVDFYNNSRGGSLYKYDFGDGSTALTRSAPEVVSHTYTRPGSYKVVLTASNGCSDTTTAETIKVLAQPAAAFTAGQTLGCPGLEVQFKNTSEGAISYLWDFGDGNTAAEAEPRHTYTGEQEFYTVSLTATNALGCSSRVSMAQYIHIVPPPRAAFNVSPSTLISIPAYTFRFEEESTGQPSVWSWDFGDHQGSSLRSPVHTYTDTGTYVVTLRVSNQQGCSAVTSKKVTIQGVPGYLYVPNAFMPGSQTPELRVFKAKGSGIRSWKMSIFNNWGQQLWETTALDDGQPAGAWDGTFRGSPMPLGVYFWKIDVEFINGAAWKGMTYGSQAPKKTGPIHLIR